MKIIEYNHKYAEQVADMWNKSGSNWGNNDSFKTGADVIARQDATGNLNLFLAVDGEEVVGYCSFSEYVHDEGACYLPLLNVRPDYHGKKVGKQLILRAIEEAIESKWMRFDLFTWDGNIKAMPLYKKCGFFWEKNNKSVHLMNFIPYIYKTEALNSYLDQIDWYNDSVKEITMVPDGVDENGFDMYSYHFRNDQTELQLEFERTGRGLRCIDSKDYLVKMSVTDHELVYNDTYEATFEVHNKGEQPLDITIQGVDNKNIKSEFHFQGTVEEKTLISLPFRVEKTSEKLDVMKTHPVVEAHILINGKKAVFKIGVTPKKPIDVELVLPEYNHVLGRTYTGYLNLEYNLEDTEEYAITINTDYFTVSNPLNVSLTNGQKHSVEFTYVPKQFGFIDTTVSFTSNQKVLEQEVNAIMKGHFDTFHGWINENPVLVNGNYHVIFDKDHASFGMSGSLSEGPTTSFAAPQIGLPFSLELSNLKPNISFPQDNKLVVSYHSEAFVGIELKIHITLQEGILETYFELENHGANRELSFLIPVDHNLSKSLIPYRGKMIQNNQVDSAGFGSLNKDYFDQNWVYNDIDKCGLTWDPEMNVEIAGWRISAKYDHIQLNTNDVFFSKKFYASFAHKSLESFLAFSGAKREKDILPLQTVKVNQGNPFILGTTTATFINEKKKQVTGSIRCHNMTVGLEEELTVPSGLQTITIDTNERIKHQQTLLFNVSGDVKQVEDDGDFIVDNGVVTFKANMSYADVLYSLQYNHQEWIDHTFPKLDRRSWWGIYTGGIGSRVDRIRNGDLLQEPRTVEFVTVTDSYGQEWKGLVVKVEIQKDEDYKGLTFEQYAVTRGNVPYIHVFTRIVNQSGKYLSNKFLYRNLFVQPDQERHNVTFDLEETTFKCGGTNVEKSVTKLISFNSTRDHILHVYNPENKIEVETQGEFILLMSSKLLSIPNQSSKILRGDSIFFTTEPITKETVEDLKNIKFEV